MITVFNSLTHNFNSQVGIGSNLQVALEELMDHLHYRLNFDLNKSRQKFHHSLTVFQSFCVTNGKLTARTPDSMSEPGVRAVHFPFVTQND